MIRMTPYLEVPSLFLLFCFQMFGGLTNLLLKRSWKHRTGFLFCMTIYLREGDVWSLIVCEEQHQVLFWHSPTNQKTPLVCRHISSVKPMDVNYSLIIAYRKH